MFEEKGVSQWNVNFCSYRISFISFIFRICDSSYYTSPKRPRTDDEYNSKPGVSGLNCKTIRRSVMQSKENQNHSEEDEVSSINLFVITVVNSNDKIFFLSVVS